MHFALATLWSLDHTTFLCTDRHLYFGLWLPMAPCLPLSPSISRLWKTSQHIFVHHNSLVRHVLSDHSEVQHKIPGKDTFEHETTLFRPHCLKNTVLKVEEESANTSQPTKHSDGCFTACRKRVRCVGRDFVVILVSHFWWVRMVMLVLLRASVTTDAAMAAAPSVTAESAGL